MIEVVAVSDILPALRALQQIREENERYAHTAVMDWDYVQDLAYVALVPLINLLEGKE
jgi:hypothetical protein